MKTAKKVEEEFRKDFQALLDKYKATMEVKDHYKGYAECGSDIRCIIGIWSVWDENHEKIQEGCDIDLGTYLSWDE